jgi:lysophospholipid acyltransferase (LPLAT)-like uncharacterized protein
MKLRQPALIKAAGFLGAGVLRGWMRTLTYRYRPLGADVNPHRPDLAGRYIYAMWHETMLVPLYTYARPDIHVLVSPHADGQLLAEGCRHLRIPLVRGSATSGGVEAVRRLLRLLPSTHLALTPDGPRGPRRQVKPGLVYLAARTGLPIVPVGFGLQGPWRLGSWDRFAIPRPWSRATCVTAAPTHVPPEADADQMEGYRRHVEETLLHVTALAERWAEGGSWRAASQEIKK